MVNGCFRSHSRHPQGGLSLLELLIATALASIVLGTLLGVVRNGLQVQTASRETNEMVYQARFALGLIVAKAQATAPKVLSTLPVNATSTGDWFAPAMYCLNTASAQLIETTPADTGCTGSRVIADNVTGFLVDRPLATGPVDRPAARISLTVATPGATQSVTLSASARLGGAVP